MSPGPTRRSNLAVLRSTLAMPLIPGSDSVLRESSAGIFMNTMMTAEQRSTTEARRINYHISHIRTTADGYVCRSVAEMATLTRIYRRRDFSMAGYTVDTVIAAPREVVFDVFADRERNGEFLPVNTRLKTPGTTERQGVGAVHFLGFGNIGPCEQITALVPNERIEYKVVAGLPVKNHTGVITFADAPSGTRVVYTMESTPILPVPAPLLKLGLRFLIDQFVSGARKVAVQRAARS